jgi:glyoxylase-like metal-dependent hydrolase (beta-lactamase superfamily II)
MSTLYFRQLLAGRDFAVGHPAAPQMQNFVYLIGDRDTGECMIVDPAWAVQELVDAAAADDMKITGALVTHYHPDHVGGDLWGMQVEGLAELLAAAPCPVHLHRAEADGVKQMTGLSDSDFVLHDSGDKVTVGDIEIELLHTPGHTPGSICFRLADALVAGDTLFLQGCGRVDLPGGDSDEMYRTITERLATLPGDTILYPGHAYGGEFAPMDAVRRSNPCLRVSSIESWRMMMG